MTSDRIRTELVTVQTQWSIDDLLDAHIILNGFADAEAAAELEK